jgi:hypothetical protein
MNFADVSTSEASTASRQLKEVATMPPKEGIDYTHRNSVQDLLTNSSTDCNFRMKEEDLKTLRELSGNKLCIDCGDTDPSWASVNLGIFMCLACSGSHRYVPLSSASDFSFSTENSGNLTLFPKLLMQQISRNSCFFCQIVANGFVVRCSTFKNA